MPMPTPSILRQRLKQAKEHSGLPWKQVEALSGYSASYLRHFVNGRRQDMTTNCVACVAAALKVSPSWLVGWDNDTAGNK